MDRLVLTAAIIVVASAAAVIMRRQRDRQWRDRQSLAAGTTTGTTTGKPVSGHIPSAISINELVAAELVAAGFVSSGAIASGTGFLVVFTEATCRTCAAALQTANGPAGAGLTVIEVEYSAHKELQKRLGIDTVPTTVVVASSGAVLAGWAGKIDEAELASVARTA